MTVDAPTWTVEIAFSAGANPNAWTLGYTALPATLGEANTDVFTDVTADVRSINVQRGKSRELDQFNAGRATVVLDNRAREYDPLNLSGTHVSGGATLVKPGRRLRIRATHPTTATTYEVYRGTIRDWKLDYVKAFDGTATVHATDSLTDIANTKVSVTTSAAASGAVVKEVLDDAGISGYSTDTGASTLQAMTFGGTAMAALRVVEQTEQGVLYVEADGVITFLDRTALANDTRHTVSQATFGSGNLTIEHVDIGYESDVIKNRVVVTREDGTAQESSDADSITAYGERLMTLTGMATANDTDSLNLAGYLVSRLAEPQVRVRSIKFHPQKHADLMTQALSRKLLDLVTVTFAPPGGGSAISQDVWVSGIRTTYTAAAGMETTFEFIPQSFASQWVLGTSQLGVDTILGF